VNTAADFAGISRQIREILGLESEPVAIYLIAPKAVPDHPAASFDRAPGHRYCQLLMRARRNERVRLTERDLACPAAAAAFGWKQLPASLASGAGLVGFGIVAEAETGHTMFADMPRLPYGAISEIAACPLALAPALPDVIVVEGRPEQLMWLLLADLNVSGGRRRRADTAVLQATCVDATIIPHLEGRMNFTLGCYGCREATDLGPEETVIGFPGQHLEALGRALGSLNAKAISRSRSRSALKTLTKDVLP